MTYSLMEEVQDNNLWNKNHFEFLTVKKNVYINVGT